MQYEKTLPYGKVFSFDILLIAKVSLFTDLRANNYIYVLHFRQYASYIPRFSLIIPCGYVEEVKNLSPFAYTPTRSTLKEFVIGGRYYH